MKQLIFVALLCSGLILLLACAGAWSYDNCSRFAVVDQWGYETPELGQGAMDIKMQQLGCKYIRSAWNWDQIEVQDDVYDAYNLALMDGMVTGMNALGVHILYNFNYTPAWARSGGDQRTPPNNPAKYTEFITYMVNRYHDSIKDWGFWNEVNIAPFWTGDYNWYIQNLLIPGIQAVKAADPTAKTVVGELSTAGDDVAKLRTMLLAIDAAGLHNQVDVISHHSYDGGDTASGRLADMDTLRAMIVSIGWGEKDFWCTETGFQSSGGEANQANQLTALMQGMDARRSWWKKTFWFTLTEGASGGFGLLRPDTSAKPSYTAYQSYIAAHATDQWTYGNSGSAWGIPRRVEAENYDDGCDGVSYHDSDAVNSGAAYRTDGVDIEGCSEGGYNVGYIDTGEWLEYTISSTGGTYDFALRVASAGGGGVYHIELDGNNVSGTKSFSGTGGWQNWTTTAANGISIPSGGHILRVYVESGGWNLNYIDINQSTGGQSPYAGVIQLPGTAQAENYDVGGEGVAYHDTTSGNAWGQYRSDNVDIDGNPDYHIGAIATGEWLEYTVNVASAGQYDILVRTSSDNTSGRFHVEMNGANVTGAQSVPNTGWSNYTNVTVSRVSLNAGQQIMRVYADVGNWNFDYLTVVNQTPYSGVISLPGTFQAENFDNGGEGAAYHDLATGNNGGAYRSTDVDIENTGDTGGGYNVGWIDGGEWLEYTVNVASAGNRTISMRTASPNGGCSVHIEMNGVNKTGTKTLPNTGGWQTYTTTSWSAINLSAGQQQMRVYIEGGGFNLNWIQVQ